MAVVLADVKSASQCVAVDGATKQQVAHVMAQKSRQGVQVDCARAAVLEPLGDAAVTDL